MLSPRPQDGLWGGYAGSPGPAALHPAEGGNGINRLAVARGDNTCLPQAVDPPQQSSVYSKGSVRLMAEGQRAGLAWGVGSSKQDSSGDTGLGTSTMLRRRSFHKEVGIPNDKETHVPPTLPQRRIPPN